MALLKSAQDGNWTDASTWNVCTAYLDSGTQSSASLQTLTGTGVATYNSTAQALGVAFRFAGRANTLTGTVTVDLNGIAGTTVTANVVDVVSTSLPSVGSSSFGHWVFFKFASPVTITNGANVTARLSTSTAGTILLTRGASTSVYSFFVVTAATQAPAATDQLFIIGDNTGIGAKTAITVTMNNANITTYGSGATTSLGLWGLYVGDTATLTWATAESTAYYLRVFGNIGVGSGGDAYPGTLSIGTTATPIPRSSSAILEVAPTTNVTHVISVQGGRFIAQGQSRSAGKNADRCFLTATAAISATSLTVDTDTGWLSGDSIVIPPTARVAGTGTSEHSLTANATSNTLTISPAIATSAREGGASGSVALQGEVILTARNVIIKSITPGTLNTWWEIIGSTTVVDCDWVKFVGMGSATANKLGMYLGSSVGTAYNVTPSNITYNNCNFDRNFTSFLTVSGTNSGAIITDCTFTNSVSTASTGVACNFTSINSATQINNCWVAQLSATSPLSFRDVNFTINGLRVCSANAPAITLTPQTTQVAATWNNIFIHSCTTAFAGSANNDYLTPLTLNNIEIQRCTSGGVLIGGLTGIIFDNFRIWGNVATNILCSPSGTGAIAGAEVIFRNGWVAGQAVNAGQSITATANGVASGMVGGKAIFENCQFGGGSALAQPHTQDINPSTSTAGQGMDVILRNTILSSPTRVISPTMDIFSVVAENLQQTVGNKQIWLKRGTVTTDTTPPRLVHSGSRSIRLQPNSASSAMEYVVARVAVVSGSTPTLGIYVRKSSLASGDTTDYALGSQPRLIVRRNILVGLYSDTVLATASAANGVWELLSGTLPTLTGDGIIEVEVDCAASAGWVNIDSFQAPTAVNTKSLEITDDTLGVSAYGDNSTGGGGSPVTVGYAFVG